MGMEPYPTKRASSSERTCLAEVPDESREWNPDMAPQAMVMNKKGHMLGACAGAAWTAGATISSLPPMDATMTPKTSSTMATTSWCELIKSLGCSKVVTGRVEAIKA